MKSIVAGDVSLVLFSGSGECSYLLLGGAARLRGLGLRSDILENFGPENRRRLEEEGDVIVLPD